MNKKADANMWWIIIGAIIALVVLVILMLIFTGSSTKLNIGLMDCESKGGSCKASSAECLNQDGEEGTTSSAFSCEEKLPKASNPDATCCFVTKSSIKKTTTN